MTACFTCGSTGPLNNNGRCKPCHAAAQREARARKSRSDARTHKLESELITLREQAKRAERLRGVAMRDAKAARQELEASLKLGKQKPLVVVPRETTSRVHEATAVLLYSDLHPDETVTPDTVSGLNEFNLDIARSRNTRLAQATRWNLEMLRDRGGAGYRIRDFILAMLGDMISNTIHPELMESNSLLPADALVEVERMACEVIDTLLADSEIETLWIPCCHGNHDRMTIKTRHQTKAGNSLAWILYSHLARHYRDEPRVRFEIARGNMLYTDVYGHAIRWTHGDDVRYGGGVGGITIPIRKAIDSWNRSRNAYMTCMGHWHQFTIGDDFIVNGSMIGYTAFAQAIKARYQPAAQAMFLLDKDYGRSWAHGIRLQERGQW